MITRHDKVNTMIYICGGIIASMTLLSAVYVVGILLG